MRSKKSLLLVPEQVSLHWYPTGLVAGVDEAGRGPLAGPVVAAAVILDDRRPIAGLADSKKLTPVRREKLYDEILSKALCCSIAQASVEEIDELNILEATMLAMRRAVRGLGLLPFLVLVDGNGLPLLYRDRWCVQVHDDFPQYGFAGHKGYGTVAHMAALRAHGACIHHRRSFAPVAQNLLVR